MIELKNASRENSEQSVSSLVKSWYRHMEDLPRLERIANFLASKSFLLEFPSGPVKSESELDTWVAGGKKAIAKSYHDIHQINVTENSTGYRAIANLTWEYTNQINVAAKLAVIAEFDIVKVKNNLKISYYKPHILPFNSKLSLSVANMARSGSEYSKINLPEISLKSVSDSPQKSIGSVVPIIDVPLNMLSVPAIVPGYAYHLTPSFEWKDGVTMMLVARKKDDQSATQFREELAKHLSIAREILVPQGLRGYLVIAGVDYELALLNFDSVEDQKRIWSAPQTAPANAHAASFLQGVYLGVLDL